MDTLIVAIGHKARQGKDTFASFFKTFYPNEVEITHWADALKEEVAYNPERILIMRDGNEVLFYDKDLGMHSPDLLPSVKHRVLEWCDANGISATEGKYYGAKEKDSILLQFWGTGYRRRQDPNYWVHKVMNTTYTKPILLIPDTRFYNEYDAVQQSGGMYVEIYRGDGNGNQFIDPDRDPLHPSECELDGVLFDYIIQNDKGTVYNLYLLAEPIVHDIIKKAL